MSETTTMNTMDDVVKSGVFKALPKVGDTVEGIVLQVTRGLLRLDVPGLKTGVIRGAEFFSAPECSQFKIGDKVSAVIADLDNEKGELELSLKMRGGAMVWEQLTVSKREKSTVDVKVVSANRGGLLVSFQGVQGFLPVSQLSLAHYPTVPDGDKEKILAKLMSFVGTPLAVTVLDFDPRQGTFVVSERSAKGEDQKTLLGKYALGQILDVAVVKIIDAGAFVEIEKGLTGFIHISELAWHYLPHPTAVVTVGQKFQAKIIGIEGEKVFLSRRKLLEDPWRNVSERYAVGQKVKGKVLKITPFGFFVEVDTEIHGLAHISELSSEGKVDPASLAKIGDTLEFTIITLEPKEHRLGLTLKPYNPSSPPAVDTARPSVPPVAL